MTLPASGAISMSQIANEVGLALPISINHPWLLQLIGKVGFPISFSDFYGKTGRYDGSLLCTGSTPAIFPGNAPFFGGTISDVQGDATSIFLFFTGAPAWTGNIRVKNNTTGISIVLAKNNSTTWSAAPGVSNLLRVGQTDSFTITPSN